MIFLVSGSSLHLLQTTIARFFLADEHRCHEGITPNSLQISQYCFDSRESAAFEKIFIFSGILLISHLLEVHIRLLGLYQSGYP